MSIFVDKNTKVVVQGITGKEGQFHTRHCVNYGTQVVAGVTPGKAGQKMDEVPVFNTVRSAVAETGAEASVIFGSVVRACGNMPSTQPIRNTTENSRPLAECSEESVTCLPASGSSVSPGSRAI